MGLAGLGGSGAVAAVPRGPRKWPSSLPLLGKERLPLKRGPLLVWHLTVFLPSPYLFDGGAVDHVRGLFGSGLLTRFNLTGFVFGFELTAIGCSFPHPLPLYQSAPWSVRLHVGWTELTIGLTIFLRDEARSVDLPPFVLLSKVISCAARMHQEHHPRPHSLFTILCASKSDTSG